MKDSESVVNSSATDEMCLAEHELSAFVAAVSELFGPEQARLSIEDWLTESDLINNSLPCTSEGWRRVTIAAAARLAKRVNVGGQRNIRCSARPNEITLCL